VKLPWRSLFLLGLLVLVLGLYVERATRPLPLKSYNILLMGGEEGVSKLSLENMTHIKSRGFCTEIWKEDVVDTVVCTPHIVSEVAPVVPSPKREETKINGST
jgi:hypothetical protein